MPDRNALQEDLFLLVGFLLSSAHGLYEEPKGYGPFRLLDAARRLVSALQSHGAPDPYLEQLGQALENACTGHADDEEMRRIANELVLGYASELRARLGSAGAGE